MACTYYTPEESRDMARQQVNDLTDKLCRLCAWMEKELPGNLDEDIAAWWEEHQKKDAERIEREARYAQAGRKQK